MKLFTLLFIAVLPFTGLTAQKKNNIISVSGGASFHDGSAFETGFFFEVKDALVLDNINQLSLSASYQKWRYKYFASHPGLLTFLIGDKFWAVPNRLYINPSAGIAQGISGYSNAIGFAACIEAGYKFGKKKDGFYLVTSYNSVRNFTDSWINTGLGYEFSVKRK